MIKKRSGIGVVMLCLATAAGIGVAIGTPPAANDQANTVQADTTAETPSGNITRSLTIYAPSVAVRANPSASTSPASRHGAQQSGQYAYVDADGKLTSTPQPGARRALPARGQTDPTPYQSAVDPNAVLIDTSHIHAAVSARINENGEIEVTCRQHTDAPDHICSIPPVAPTNSGDQTSASASIKEIR